MATNPFQAQVDDLTNSTQVKPVTTAFDESKSTAGRVDSIIAKGSPLMERAAAKAKQGMNARGLMNSSMAIGAGQAAVMDAATPIAVQDASLFQQAQIANQNSLNQGNQFNAATKADIGTKGMSLGESGRQFDEGQAGTNDRFTKELAQRDEQFGVESSLKTRELDQRDTQFGQELAQRDTQFAQKLDQDVKMAGIDRDTKMALIQTEAKYKTDIAGNENIANAWATTMRDIGAINNNPDLGDEAKRTMIDNARGGFEQFTKFWAKATGGTVNVSDLLSFGGPGAATGSAGGSTSGSTGGSLAGNAQLAREAAAATTDSNDLYLDYVRNNGGSA